MNRPEIGPYSFLIVFRKTAYSEGSNQQPLHRQLEQVWAERDSLKLRVSEREQALSIASQQAQQLGECWHRLEQHPAIRVVRAAQGIRGRLRRALGMRTPS